MQLHVTSRILDARSHGAAPQEATASCKKTYSYSGRVTKGKYDDREQKDARAAEGNKHRREQQPQVTDGSSCSAGLGTNCVGL